MIFTIRDENGVKLCLEGLSELQTKMTTHFEHTSFLLFHAPIYTSRDYRQVEADVHIPKRTHCSLFTSNDFLISHTSLADNTSISIFNGQMEFF